MDAVAIFNLNRKSTKRMSALINKLTNEDLVSILPNGWTVAATLMHLAFWDQRVLHVMELAEQQGRVTPSNYDDSLNDILNVFLQEIPPRRAAEMAVAIAGQLDAKLEDWPSNLLDDMDAVNHRWVERSLHRTMHLDDIEHFLHS